MPPSRSLPSQGSPYLSRENESQNAIGVPGRDGGETVQRESERDRQKAQAQTFQSNNESLQLASEIYRESSTRHDGSRVPNSHGTGHRRDRSQQSTHACGSRRRQNDDANVEREIGDGSRNDGTTRQIQRRKIPGHPGGTEIRLLGGHHEKSQLPEPALTAMLPKGRKEDTPTKDNGQLSMLAAVAEEYDRRLRPNLGGATLQTQHNSNENQQGNTEKRIKQVLPSLTRSWNEDSAEAETSMNLPSLKQVIRQMMDQSVRAMNEEQKASFRREVEAVRQEKLAKTNVNSQPITKRQSGNDGAPQNENAEPTRDLSERAAHAQDITPELGMEVVKRMGTARTVNARRLRDRGHENGFVSFGEYVQADMPSPSLSHFSIMKRRRTTFSQSTASRPLERGNGGQPFNIFQAILKRPELVITFARHLRIQELLTLFSTCRPFHDIVKLRLTTVVVSQALIRAPDSAKTFPFRCYKKLCVEDPARRPHPVTEKAAAGEIRKVPSFRWLRMVCFREMVCHEIMTIMAEDGVPLPDACEPVLKKIWFLMDLPDNRRRIGMVQNCEIFSDMDIFFATLFFVKMDMRFTDPLTGSGKDGMRRLLMAQPSLSTFWRTLKRTALISKLDVIKLFVRWKYTPRPAEASHGIFGIPPSEIGIVQYEAWGRTGSRVPLQRPDELILLESIRRDLRLDEKYTDMFLWGYVNPNTMENFPPVVRRRKLDRLDEWEGDLVPSEDKGKLTAPKRVSTRVIQN